MRDTKYKIAFFTALLFGILPLAMYFYNFHYGFSPDHGAWSEFGSFYGGMLSPAIAGIAFIGLLWNLDVTKKQFCRQSEDNTFFNLINLHNNKVQMTTFSTAPNTDVLGFAAFKEYVEEFNLLYDKEAVRIARIELAQNTRKLTHYAYNFLWQKYARQFNEKDKVYMNDEDQQNKIISYFENSADPWELQKGLIGTDDAINMEDRKCLIDIGHVVLSDAFPRERIQSIERVNEIFYHDFGHMLGHYFRNIHYILTFIDESERSIELSKIFRAQLSRYELTMLYYNSLSKLSSAQFIDLLTKYNIFNGIYWADICYSPDSEKRGLDLDYIFKEKLTSQCT